LHFQFILQVYAPEGDTNNLIIAGLFFQLHCLDT
jgi:hypothetical protein